MVSENVLSAYQKVRITSLCGTLLCSLGTQILTPKFSKKYFFEKRGFSFFIPKKCSRKKKSISTTSFGVRGKAYWEGGNWGQGGVPKKKVCIQTFDTSPYIYK